MSKLPLISCLTISTGRLRLLKQAIGCYLAQTYPHRELVIVTGTDLRYRRAVEIYLNQLGRSDIRAVHSTREGARLGYLRNLSMAEARGDLICQWDDDDLYHPERLRLQQQRLAETGSEACFLTDFLQFYTDTRELYWLDWTCLSALGEDRPMLPGSMLVVRDERLFYPSEGREAEVGEDNKVRDQIFQYHDPVGLSGCGYVYVYRFHGRNVWPRTHHQCLTPTAVDGEFMQSRLSTLRAALAALPLPLPYRVVSRDGQTIFVYDGPSPGDRAVVRTGRDRQLTGTHLQ